MGPVGEDVTDLDLAARAPVNVMVTAGDAADRATFARLIHDRSARRDAPFVTAPAFADATTRPAICSSDVDNWFEQAAGGTLFIDRIGELPPEAQARLFSLLNQQRDHGRAATMPYSNGHVRVLTGSDRSLDDALAAGAFDGGLFYRLNVIHIDLAAQGRPDRR